MDQLGLFAESCVMDCRVAQPGRLRLLAMTKETDPPPRVGPDLIRASAGFPDEQASTTPDRVRGDDSGGFGMPCEGSYTPMLAPNVRFRRCARKA